MNYFAIWVGGEKKLVKIGKWTTVAGNTLINTNWWKVTIWKYVMISQNVSLITWTHDYTKFWKERIATIPKWFIWDIMIEDGARICNNAIIIWPCTIWKNSVVAAWSVVTKDVPDYAIVWWNPAKIIKLIQKNSIQNV
jgi:acetyltransferase-like isoleucine patch superfamily enzyme